MSDVNIRIQAQGGNEAAAQFNKTAAGLTNVSKASGQANTALLNLGRVAQDAPFGFIGIQNNLNPLLESFQRLSAESGGAKNAFIALGKSLVGGAGLGLAISAVTSAITYLSMEGFLNFKSSADQASEATKKYKEELSGIANTIAKEAEGVASLISVLKNETETRETKLDVIKKLNQISPEVFKNLQIEKGEVIGLNQSYKNYIGTLKNAYTVQILKAKLDKEFAKLIELEGAARTKSEKRNRALLNFYSDVENKSGRSLKKAGENAINFAQSLDPIRATKGRIEEIIKTLADFDNVVKNVGGNNGVEKKVRTINDVLAELEKTLSALEQQEILFNVDKSRDKIKAFEGTIQTLFKDFGLKAGDSVIQSLNERLKGIFISLEREIRNFKPITSLQIKLDEEQARKEIEQATPKLKPITLPVSVTKDSYDELRKKIQDFLDKASDIRYNTLINSFAGLGDAIGQAIGEGANIGEAIFGNLFKVLGAGLKEIGNALIQLGIAKKALESFKIAPGIGTIIAGIAAIAAGTLLQNIKLPGFADGVTNFKGGFAIVGERGPEVLRLPKGSDVIPNHALNSMMPSSGTTYIPNVTLRGTDLVIAFDRANKTNSRNG